MYSVMNLGCLPVYIITISTITLLTYAFYRFLHYLEPDCTRIIYDSIKKAWHKFYWNGVIQLLNLFYMSVTVSTLLNLMRIDFESASTTFTSLLTIFSVILLICLPTFTVVHLYHTWASKKEYEFNKEKL